MIGRRKSIVGLSLLAVLAFCAFSAQGASAAWETATNTTAFTCVEGGGKRDFSDSHCTNNVGEGNGSYGHAEFTENKTDIDASSEETSILKGKLLTAEVEIVCHKTSPDTSTTSFIENTLEGTKHDFHGTIAVNFTECFQTGLGETCKVKGDTGSGGTITLHSLFRAVENPPGKGGDMAIQFEPTEGTTTFVTIEFEGTCPLFSANVKGKARGRGAGTGGTGSTVQFKPADEELTFGGNPATFEGKFTVTNAENGRGISATTVT